MEYSATQVEDLKRIARSILDQHPDHRVFAFFGAMGSGKTTLISALCDTLKCTDHVSSPTFSIVNEYQYQGDHRVFHFDFYRIKSEEEAYDLGYEDYFYSGDYCFIEWPEKIPNLLPEPHITVEITENQDIRTIKVV